MSSSHISQRNSVVPAQLSFLAIYNPCFGDSDETAYEQIFFYHSRHSRDEGPAARDDFTQSVASAAPNTGPVVSQEHERNEQLRKVGLARGMVEFAK